MVKEATQRLLTLARTAYKKIKENHILIVLVFFLMTYEWFRKPHNDCLHLQELHMKR